MVRRMSATGTAAVAIWLAAAFAGPAAAAPAAPTQARTPAAAAAGDIVLFGVSCARAVRCLAVGQESTSANLGFDVARAWDGRRWRILAPPSPGSPAGLSGVACAGPAACIAVGGYASKAGPGRTLAVAWNGTRWRVLTTPGTGNSELTGIACSRPDRCIAVGDRFVQGGRRTLAEAWNGTTWRVLPAADTRSADATLGAISCARSDRCMATGTRFAAAGRTVALAESWNGIRWRVLRTPSPGTMVTDLAGVSCAGPARCIAVGYDMNRGQPAGTALAERWNGTRWRLLPRPRTGSGSSSLLAVSCTGPARCLALGAQVRNGTGGPLAEAWNGTRWRTLPTASLGTANANLLSISCPRPGRCTAVGDDVGTAGHARPLAEQWNGRRWRVTSQ